MLEEDEFVLLGEGDLTLALRNNLNSGQRETEVPDGESRWGEPDDDPYAPRFRGNDGVTAFWRGIYGVSTG